MKMKIVHAYSDNANIDLFAYCYSLEEAFDEKIRSLAERSRPRDLYDVVSLFKEKQHLIDKQVLIKTLKRKCQFKKISIPTLDNIYRHAKFDELNTEWKIIC